MIYRGTFTNQSQQAPNNEMTHKRKLNNQSETSKTFEKTRDMNKINEQAETSPSSNSIKFKSEEPLQIRNRQQLPLLPFRGEKNERKRITCWI